VIDLFHISKSFCTRNLYNILYDMYVDLGSLSCTSNSCREMIVVDVVVVAVVVVVVIIIIIISSSSSSSIINC